MQMKISSQGMDFSQGLETRANQWLQKFEEFAASLGEPQVVHFHFKSHHNHAHQEVSINLKAKNLDLNVHQEGNDMYAVLDQACEKLIVQIKKEKSLLREQHQSGDRNKF